MLFQCAEQVKLRSATRFSQDFAIRSDSLSPGGADVPFFWRQAAYSHGIVATFSGLHREWPERNLISAAKI
jgi:hypothetical protein